jgi:hypothetical protein
MTVQDPAMPAAPLAARGADRIGAIVAMVSLVLLWYWLTVVWHILATPGALVVDMDFRVFWGAARLAAIGEPLAAFDTVRLAEMHGDERDVWLPWAYPPGLLLAFYPLGFMDFFTALVTLVVVSLLAILGAVRLYAGNFRPVWIAFAFLPAILPALVSGQVSVLWVGGLVAALAAIRDGRAVLAGVILGLLTFKPQLGPLVALACIASRNWRVIGVAAATTVAFHGLATLAYGVAYWPAFLDMAGRHADKMRESIGEAELMVSIYSTLIAFGLREGLALGLQLAVSAVATLAVWLAWSSRTLEFDAKAAILVTAIPVASPYFWFAETAFLAPALMLLMRTGALRARGPGLVLILLMGVGVAPLMMLQLLTPIDVPPRRLFAGPVLLAAFLVAAAPLIGHLRSRIQGT